MNNGIAYVLMKDTKDTVDGENAEGKLYTIRLEDVDTITYTFPTSASSKPN